MVSDELARLFTTVEVLKTEFKSLEKELDYKHKESKKDVEVLHKRIEKLEANLTDRIDMIRKLLDSKYLNGNSNGVANRVSGWSDKKRATVGGGVGIGVIIAIVELFNIYKGA